MRPSLIGSQSKVSDHVDTLETRLPNRKKEESKCMSNEYMQNNGVNIQETGYGGKGLRTSEKWVLPSKEGA